MQQKFVEQLQEHLKALGLYTGNIDGIAGNGTKTALEAMITAHKTCAINCKPDELDAVERVYWGSKVSKTFRDRVLWMRDALGMPKEGANWLMSVMAFETGRSFRADVKNAAGSSGTGLIQFMSFTAKAMGTTVEALAKMTPEDQLNWVYKYFSPYKGKLNSLGDVYFVVLYPKAVGHSDDWVLWEKGTLSYTQNKGLDKDVDGKVTRKEVLTTITKMYTEGKQHEA
ncbi:MAG: peptidoglycan-binding domain-containing protein [Bacteroidaceae bacterium]